MCDHTALLAAAAAAAGAVHSRQSATGPGCSHQVGRDHAASAAATSHRAGCDVRGRVLGSKPSGDVGLEASEDGGDTERPHPHRLLLTELGLGKTVPLQAGKAAGAQQKGSGGATERQRGRNRKASGRNRTAVLWTRKAAEAQQGSGRPQDSQSAALGTKGSAAHTHTHTWESIHQSGREPCSAPSVKASSPPVSAWFWPRDQLRKAGPLK